jgi:hypothetical protein
MPDSKWVNPEMILANTLRIRPVVNNYCESIAHRQLKKELIAVARYEHYAEAPTREHRCMRIFSPIPYWYVLKTWTFSSAINILSTYDVVNQISITIHNPFDERD